LPLTLPNLDDLRWQDIIVEGRSLIPANAPDWTNHNPSDPGITLIELFAYVCEKLMYRLNRVGDGNIAEFLSLIDGPGWKSEHHLLDAKDPASVEFCQALSRAVSIDEKRRVVSTLSDLTRAVTPADFECLTCAVEGVARAVCIPKRNLGTDDPILCMSEAPGHVSVVVLPVEGRHPSEQVLGNIRQTLEKARLLTTRVHVAAPRYVTVSCRATITPVRGISHEKIHEAVIDRLRQFLDPHQGGFEKKGWPWGRNIFLSELYRLLTGIPGVREVRCLRDARGNPADEFIVDEIHQDRIRRNGRGEIEAIELHPDELFDPQIDPAQIVIASDL
jgi:Baseplate J-like protein